MSDSAAAASSMQVLLELMRRARQATRVSELAFMLVNDSHALAPYRQAALWLADEGIQALSGLVQVEANAPYVLWVDQVCHAIAAQDFGPVRVLTASDLPPELARDWDEWWPAHTLWLSLAGEKDRDNATPGAGFLLVRDERWTTDEQDALREWADAWWHAFAAVRQPRIPTLRALANRARSHLTLQSDRRWWQQPIVRWSAVALAVLVFPVRLTVMAPGELVPAHPVVIRAPLDGVVDVFHVQPNQLIRKDQPLFGFDEAIIQSRREVAMQTLATAETDYRQTSQQALTDAKFKPQLALLNGKIEEKRAELDYLNDQLTRARVLAPQDGIALFDDPAEWIGRPVNVGERIMRIADATDSEVEAWLPIADAIVLPPDAAVNLYLNASPLFAISAKLRYLAHDAVQRPDGSYAYRVRASLLESTGHRIGLKGTAKLNGQWVPLGYWVLRRPLAALRTAVGV